MTVGQLIEKLNKMDSNLKILVDVDYGDDDAVFCDLVEVEPSDPYGAAIFKINQS